MRHNEVRDLTASLLGDVCGDVQIKPTLGPLSGEAQFCRSANGLPRQGSMSVPVAFGAIDSVGRCSTSAFFTQMPPSVRIVPVASQYVKQEKAKRRQYEQRVRNVEGASFVPLVLSTSGGMGRSAAVTFKPLSAMLAEKAGSTRLRSHSQCRTLPFVVEQ